MNSSHSDTLSMHEFFAAGQCHVVAKFGVLLITSA